MEISKHNEKDSKCLKLEKIKEVSRAQISKNYYKRNFYRLNNLIFKITYTNYNGSSDKDCRVEILNNTWDCIATSSDLDIDIIDYISSKEAIEENMNLFFKLMEKHILELYKNSFTK